LKIGDFGIFELKVTRIDASTPITLFTKEPSRPKIGWKKIIKQYGYIDKKGRSALKFGITYVPCVMIGPVARYCIQRWLKDARTIIDPFVGSRSVLVEASMLGKKSIGIDLNPLAILLSRVKTRKLNSTQLFKLSEKLESKLSEIANSKSWSVDYPFIIPESITNWEEWYNPVYLHQLQIIRSSIDSLTEREEFREYFYVPLSELLREASYQRNG